MTPMLTIFRRSMRQSYQGITPICNKIYSSPLIPPAKITRMNFFFGSLLYYARAIDNTLLPDLNTIAAKQAAATKQMGNQYHRFIVYVATQPNVSLIFHKIDMVLTIDSDATYIV